MTIDLKKEQQATLARPRLHYSLPAKLLFGSMDVLYGPETTPYKIRLLETLARIPYQAWEIKQYWRLTMGHREPATRQDAEGIIHWGREAQDNEYWHLLTVSDKIVQDKLRESWFRRQVIPPVAAFVYRVFSRLLALVSIRAAWTLNAYFEDHAEHAFMQFVADNPQLEDEPVESEVAQDGRGPDGGRYASWADVFRRFGLDEREHRNESLRRCGMRET